MTREEKAATFLGWKPGRAPAPDIADNFVEAARKAYLDLFVGGDPRLTAFQRGGLMYAIEMVLYENSAEPLINFLAQMYDEAAT